MNETQIKVISRSLQLAVEIVLTICLAKALTFWWKPSELVYVLVVIAAAGTIDLVRFLTWRATREWLYNNHTPIYYFLAFRLGFPRGPEARE
jgi:uncharacterized protein involved in response to NO